MSAAASATAAAVVPILLSKAYVRGYVTADGKAVAPHEDNRVQRPPPRPEGGGGSPVGAGGGGEKAPREAPMPEAKKYKRGDGGGGYRVGQTIRVRGHEGDYTVTKVQGAVAWAEGPDGEIEVRQPAPMAKAAAAYKGGPIPLLLKACDCGPEKGKKPAGKPAAPGAKAPAQGGQDKGKAGGGGGGAAGAAAGGGAPQGKPSVPPRGAPDGEHTMEHQERVAFQHGKVRGEGTIVASGADGVMVQDDAGREHPVRHDNLLGPADSAETPDELPKDENGKPTTDPSKAKAGAGKGDGEAGGAGDTGGDGEDAEGAAAELAAMDPGTLAKIMRALKVLAPLFGGSPSKSAAADKKAPAK